MLLKKIKNSITFFVLIMALSFATNVYFILKKYPAISIFVGLINLFILLRISKVLKKKILTWFNGPQRFCKGKGIEIGSGGKPILKGSILVDLVDNFSSDKEYKVDYIADAHELPKIDTVSLDYVCASHVLEHLTNPIKAILEWLRILKRGGIIWLKIPDRRKTFDRYRERTTLAHLIEDFKNSVSIDDSTHIDDFNKNTDPSRNETHPYIHNHVWVKEDIVKLFNYINAYYQSLDVVACQENSMNNSQDFWIVVRKV